MLCFDRLKHTNKVWNNATLEYNTVRLKTYGYLCIKRMTVHHTAWITDHIKKLMHQMPPRGRIIYEKLVHLIAKRWKTALWLMQIIIASKHIESKELTRQDKATCSNYQADAIQTFCNGPWDILASRQHGI